MSIYAYVGLPGSGKSYGVVANQIIPALKEGRRVVTNVPLHIDAIREEVQTGEIVEFGIDEVASDPNRIDDYAKPGSVLILDELWKLFPAGQKVNHVPEPFKRLLAEHRHMVDADGRSMQIVFVTQDLAQIGAFARQLVEETFLHKKLGHLGASGSYSCTIYRGAQTGQNPPQNSELRSMLGRYDKRIYRFYKSHTMSESGKAGANEKSVDTRALIWKRPIFAVIGVGAVAFLIFAPGVLGEFFGGGSKATVAPSIVPRSTVLDTRTGVSGHLDEVAKSRMVTVTWRVSGFVDAGSDVLALLSSTDGRSVLIDGRTCQRSRFISQCKYQGQWVRFEPNYLSLENGSRPMDGPMVQALTD